MQPPSTLSKHASDSWQRYKKMLKESDQRNSKGRFVSSKEKRRFAVPQDDIQGPTEVCQSVDTMSFLYS